jgi:DNA helicase-2/ATP-dependent DNA helicase PcrA
MSSIALTAEQRQIVAHTGPALLIHAVAGSGKTTTLAHCVAHQEKRGTPGSSIVVLVFTPAAQEVFRQRLAQAGASTAIRVATYTEFARSLLDDWREQGRIDGAQAWLPDAQAMRPFIFQAIEDASADTYVDGDYDYSLHNLHAEIVVNQLSRLKGTLAMDRFEEESDHELADSLDLPRGLVAICRRYERMRRLDMGQYAFQAEQDLVADVLQASADLDLPLPQPALVVADEWHDANAAQAALLRLLTGPGTRVIVAGDREQVVHSWNGADPRYLGEAFDALFPGTRYLPLTQSFRCGATLAAGAQALTAQDFHSGRTGDTLIDVVDYDPDTDACPQRLIEVLKREASAVPLSETAVILHDAHQSIAIENALIAAGIAYAVDGCPSYFDRIEILMLRGILHIAARSMTPVTQPAQVEGILRALGLYADLRYDDREWQDAARTIAAEPGAIDYFHAGRLSQAVDAQETVDAATRRWRQRFAGVCAQLIEAAARNEPAGAILAQAARELQIAETTRRLFVHRLDAQAVSRSIDGFIAYAAQTGLPATGFLAHLHEAQHRSGAFRRNRQRLTLTTARAAKGKEWRHVHLPFVAAGEFPQAHADAAEERRLFYVAMTRASERLFLYAPTGRASHFIEALNLPAARKAGRVAQSATAAQQATRVYLDVPYAEKDQARQLGAQWDPAQRKWWISAVMPRRPFAKWLPAADKR